MPNRGGGKKKILSGLWSGCTSVNSLGEKIEQRDSETMQFSSYFQPAGGKDNLSDTVDTAFFSVRDRKTY